MPIKVVSTLEPNGPFAVVNESYVQGGFRTVSTTAERDAISSEYKKDGMLVYVTADGSYYRWVNASSSWIETTFNAGRLGGKNVDSTLPQNPDGYVLTYSTSSGNWSAKIIPTTTASAGSPGIIQLAGDLAGTGTSAISPRVSGLQGNPVVSGIPTAGQILTWDTTLATASWKALTPAIATTTSSGGITLAGDLAGTGTSATLPRVSGIQGREVVSTAPTSGQVFSYVGSTTNKWVPTTIGGEVTGSIDNISLTKIRGKDIDTATAITDGHLLAYVGSTTNKWVPTTIGGDIVGPVGNVTLTKIRGKAISTSANNPATGSVFAYNGTEWTPTSIGGDATGSVDNVTVNKVKNKEYIYTNPAAGEILAYDSTGATAWRNKPISGDINPRSSDISNIAVTKLQGVNVSPTGPTSDQVFSYNITSSNWEPTSIGGDIVGPISNATVKYLRGKEISTTTPTNYDILTYSTVNNKWEPRELAVIPVTTISTGTIKLNSRIDQDSYVATDANTFIHWKFDEAEGTRSDFRSSVDESNSKKWLYAATGSCLSVRGSTTDLYPIRTNIVTTLTNSLSPTKKYLALGNTVNTSSYLISSESPALPQRNVIFIDKNAATIISSSADNPFLAPNDITVSLWVKLATLNNATKKVPIIQRGRVSSSTTFSMHILAATDVVNGTTAPAGSWAVQIYTGSDQILNITSSDSLLTTGVWTLLTFTYSSNTNELIAYKDGQVAGIARNTSTTRAIESVSTKYYLGTSAISSTYGKLDGSVDDIRISKVVRDRRYIRDVYEGSMYNGTGSSPVHNRGHIWPDNNDVHLWYWPGKSSSADVTSTTLDDRRTLDLNYRFSSSVANGITIKSDTTNISVSCWVYLPSTASADWTAIVIKDWAPSNLWSSPYASFEITTTGDTLGSWYVGVVVDNVRYITTIFTNTSNKIPTDVWTLLSFTYNTSAKELKVYRNGVNIRTQSVSGATGTITYNTGAYYVGGHAASTYLRSFPGRIRDVRIDCVVRSEQYYLDMFNGYSSPYNQNTNLGHILPDSNTINNWRFENYVGKFDTFADTGLYPAHLSGKGASGATPTANNFIIKDEDAKNLSISFAMKLNSFPSAAGSTITEAVILAKKRGGGVGPGFTSFKIAVNSDKKLQMTLSLPIRTLFSNLQLTDSDLGVWLLISYAVSYDSVAVKTTVKAYKDRQLAEQKTESGSVYSFDNLPYYVASPLWSHYADGTPEALETSYLPYSGASSNVQPAVFDGQLDDIRIDDVTRPDSYYNDYLYYDNPNWDNDRNARSSAPAYGMDSNTIIRWGFDENNDAFKNSGYSYTSIDPTNSFDININKQTALPS